MGAPETQRPAHLFFVEWNESIDAFAKSCCGLTNAAKSYASGPPPSK
jgi:hypothetical protein